MKKLLLVLFAFTTGNMMAQKEASASTTINAKIVSPISIANDGVINFGNLASPANVTKVTIAPDGERTYYGDDILVTSEISNASFLVKAADTYAYTVTVSAEALKSGGEAGAPEMPIEITQTETKLTGNGQEQRIGLTSTLTVNAEQPAGEYKGEVFMTVAYQ